MPNPPGIILYYIILYYIILYYIILYYIILCYIILYYIILYYIIYFRLVVYIVTCTVFRLVVYIVTCTVYTPPPPPPHSASYNIAATTTCASRVSVLADHRKRPPVQVTVATTTCASRVSVLVGHRKDHQCKLQWPPPYVPESKCAQWLKKKTTSASYSRSEPAPPPLECTLQQANVSLPKGMPLN